jgi:glucose/arabinose dehydrogenase
VSSRGHPWACRLSQRDEEAQVWGRPVGISVGKDGALYVTDDGSKTIWRVTYTGK